MSRAELPLSEEDIEALWEKQKFPAAALNALGYHVVFRGLPSDAGGPDYQEAILETPRGLVHGDIEFHVRSSDWYRHGHHYNRRFNSVVLHVVWTSDTDSVTREDGHAVPTLDLSACYVDGIPTVEQYRLFQGCSAQVASKTDSDIVAAVHAAGMRRFDERVQFFAAEVCSSDADQVAYGHLMESLGYASNRDSFRALAELLPYSYLASLPVSEWPSILAFTAGFSSSSVTPVSVRLPPGRWRVARIRPTNHPARRLSAFAALLQKLRPSPIDALCHVVAASQRPSDLRRALVSRTAHGMIGRGRADEMAISVVLPLVAAIPEYQSKAAELYGQYPSPPANRWTRHMVQMLAEAGHQYRVRSAVEHQGLHYLYHRACRTSNLAACTLCALAPVRSGGIQR